MKHIEIADFIDLSVEELKAKQHSVGWALSLIGLIIYAVLRLAGQKPRDYHGICPYFEFGRGWGGFSAGWFFICSTTCSEYTKMHEVGHIIQNAIVGGLPMVGYTMCSIARYWVRKITDDNTPYDDWFFEGDATRFGTMYVQHIINSKE